MSLFLTYLAIAVGISFICSMLEAVLLSISPAYINVMLQEGQKLGHDLQKLKDNIDRPLSAILTLNTFANTAGAAGVGAQAQHLWGNDIITIVSFLLTLIILFVSEIIPKTLGVVHWKKLMPFATPIIRFLVFILAPAVWVSQLITGMLKSNKTQSILSRADFKAMAEIGGQDGIFLENELAIIKNLLNFNKIFVKDIMTPRTVVLAADENISLLAFIEKFRRIEFSRIPIFKKNIDQVSGFVLKDEILQALIDKKTELVLKDLKRTIQAIPEVASVPMLYRLFIEQGEHIALVVDEFGGMAGIVTMEDIIETLLGLEITDEMDRVDDLRELARKNWEKRARRLGISAQKTAPGDESKK